MGVAGFRSAAGRVSADGGPAACSFVPLHATTRKPMRQLLKNTFTLALALVFTAGMAFGQAQNDDVPGGFGDNASVVKQVDAGNQFFPAPGPGQVASATVDQAGSGNVSLLYQGSGGVPQGGQEGTIRQIGNNNYTNIFQQPNFTGHSDVLVEMLGNNNTVSKMEGVTSGSDTDVRVGGESIYNVQIDGNRNKVGSAVITSSEVSITVQGNDNNITNVSESVPPGNAAIETKSTIDVLGSGNDISVLQGSNAQGFPFGPTGRQENFSLVQVEGSSNSVSVRQDFNTTSFSTSFSSGSLLNTGFIQ